METLRADHEDAAELLTLQRLAYQSEAVLYDNHEIPPLTQSLAELQAEFATHIFLKLIEQGKIIGSVRATQKDNVCYIGRLIVHPDWQKRGIGTTLMHEIERCYPDAKTYRLFTGSRSEGNIRLYERLGYHIVTSALIDAHLTLVYMEKQGVG